MTFTGNLSLSGLSNGDHTLTIYANDNSSMGASETMYFIVSAATPYPIQLTVTAVIVAVIVSAAIGMYHIKTKRSSHY